MELEEFIAKRKLTRAFRFWRGRLVFLRFLVAGFKLTRAFRIWRRNVMLLRVPPPPRHTACCVFVGIVVQYVCCSL